VAIIAASSTAIGFCDASPIDQEAHRDAVVEMGGDAAAADRRPAVAVNDQVVADDRVLDAGGGEGLRRRRRAGRSP